MSRHRGGWVDERLISLIKWVKIRAQLMTGHLPAHRFFNGDGKVRRNAAVPICALPDSRLTGVAAPCQLNLGASKTDRLIDRALGDYVHFHSLLPFGEISPNDNSGYENGKRMLFEGQ
jgi:hypothetical protein